MRLATWYRESAAWVARPKYVVSWLGEPLPEVEMTKPFPLRNTCRALTSEPIEPRVRERVKMETAVQEVLVPPPADTGVQVSPAGQTEVGVGVSVGVPDTPVVKVISVEEMGVT